MTTCRHCGQSIVYRAPTEQELDSDRYAPGNQYAPDHSRLGWADSDPVMPYLCSTVNGPPWLHRPRPVPDVRITAGAEMIDQDLEPHIIRGEN
jgi:hypothetical protein